MIRRADSSQTVSQNGIKIIKLRESASYMTLIIISGGETMCLAFLHSRIYTLQAKLEKYQAVQHKWVKTRISWFFFFSLHNIWTKCSDQG